MKRSTSGSYWRRSIRVGGLWLALLAGGTTLAEPLPPPGGLYNAGDYYLYRDRSSVPLWRSTNEIALRRDKALSQGTALAAAGGKAVLLSVDAFATNAIEIYTVDDAAKAVQNLNARNEIAWVSPMLAVPGAGSRLLLSDEVSVQLREGADVDATLAEIARRGLQIVRMPLPSGPGLYLLRFSSPKAVDALAETRSLMNVPGIAWAEPNFIAEMQFYFTPNDQFLGRQQGLHNTGTNGGVLGADVHCPEAWDVKRGNANLVIAIIDTGVDTSHPDLSIFRNDNEWGNGRENNGVDNDGNGYVDDYRGWDFNAGFGPWDNNPNPGPGTDNEAPHGTLCAGLAGAIANNGVGIAGAAYTCKILPVKITDDTGTNFTSFESMGNAIRYAAQFSDVISCSWGGIGSSSSFIDSAIDYATISARNGKGCAVFFASGNNASHWAAHQDRLPLTVGPGTYKFGFYFETSGSHSCVQEYCENLVIDQVRLLNQTGYDRVWWEDFEGGGPGWTVAHGGGATSDWALNTQPNLLLTGVGSTQGYRPPPLILAGQPGQWAELRSPALSLSGNYILAFAKLMDFSTVGAQFQIKLLDANDNLLSVLTNIPLGWGTGSVGAGYISYPASYVNSVAVGACTDFDRRADYSQYGPQLFCVGPSNGGWNGVASTDTTGAAGWNSGDWENGDYYMGFGGTSAATPLVAGVASLILSKNANLTPSQLKDSLRLGCDKVGPLPYVNGRNDEYGYGRVNAYASITNATADTTAPTVTSVVTKWGRGVEVTFSEQMGDGVTTAANYTLSGAGKGTLTTNPSSVSWVSGYKYILEWSGGEMLTGTGNITITVSAAVKDIAGNSLGSPSAGTANGSRVVHQISCGARWPENSYPIYPFDSERYWYSSGAGTAEEFGPVNSIINNDGTPSAVYGTSRHILTSTYYPGDIFYTFPGISTGVGHTVRLYFYDDGYSTHPGDVEFDVYINNTLVLANFDLIAASGGPYVGFWREFSNVTGISGTISVKIVPKQTWNQTWSAYYYNATISGIKVTAQ